jgi:hypothetical protein
MSSRLEFGMLAFIFLSSLNHNPSGQNLWTGKDLVTRRICSF